MSKRKNKGRSRQRARRAVVKEEAKNGKRDMGIWLLQMLIVGIAAILLYKMVEVRASGNETTKLISQAQTEMLPGSMKILVVDTQRLMQAQINQAQEQIAKGAQLNQQQLEMKGKIFGTELLRAVKKYRDKGYLVVDRRNALAVPSEIDITENLAKSMKLELPEYTDPFSAPALSN